MTLMNAMVLAYSAVLIACVGTQADAQSSAASSSRARIAQRYTRETDQYDRAFDSYRESQRLNEPFHYDLSPLAAYLESVMRGSRDPAARQLAAVYLPNLRGYDVALKPEIFAEVSRIVPPESPLWKKVGGPGSIGYEAAGLPTPDARRFLDAIVARNSDPAVRGRALVELAKVAHRLNDTSLYASTYEKLGTYKNIGDLNVEIILLDPANNSAIGKRAAIFILPRIVPAGTAMFSNKSLMGKYYLLDFWATWCGPCLGERAALMSAYQRFKGKNFEIVSISADKSPDTVRDFFKTHWSMPWVNVFLTDGLKGQIGRQFDVNRLGLPHLVLVNPQGQIVALRDELDSDVLSQTLSRYLGN